MAFDPMQGFKVGQEVGKSKRSSLSRTSGYMSDIFKTRDEEAGKFDKGRYDALTIDPVEQSQIDLNSARSKRLNKPGATAGRKTAILNTRTGKAYEPVTNRELTPEEVTSGEWIMRNASIPAQGSIDKSTSAEASIKQIDDLKALLTRNRSNPLFKALGEQAPAIGGDEAQRYNIIRKDFSDRLLRLRSGAQINEDEYSRLMGMLPQFWRSSDVDIEQLDKFKSEYQNLINKISTASFEDQSSEAPAKTEEQLVAEALGRNPGKRNAILAKYKERTGKDYNG